MKNENNVYSRSNCHSCRNGVRRLKERGGTNDDYTNPEQLFIAG